MRAWGSTVGALTFLLVAATILAGCDLFGDEEKVPKQFTESVVVANGGNFGDQNGFLSLYDPQSGVVSESADLGGFVHAIAIRDNEIFALLNTFSTGRISVVEAASGSVVRQIQDIPGPRGITFVNETLAVATNLSPFGQNGPEPAVISMFNQQTGALDPATIEVGIYPEGIVEHQGRLYVANSGNLGDGRTLSVIDVATRSAAGSIDLGCDGPNEIFVDTDADILVVCEGKVVYNDDFSQIIDQTNGQIVVVNPTSQSVVARTVLPTQAGSENGSQSAFYSESAGELYVIDSASETVYRYDSDTDKVVATIEVPEDEGLVGLSAVAYDGLTGTLYIARLARGAGGFPDFSASGAVVVLNRSGTQVDRFGVGPAPSHIDFLRSEE